MNNPVKKTQVEVQEKIGNECEHKMFIAYNQMVDVINNEIKPLVISVLKARSDKFPQVRATIKKDNIDIMRPCLVLYADTVWPRSESKSTNRFLLSIMGISVSDGGEVDGIFNHANYFRLEHFDFNKSCCSITTLYRLFEGMIQAARREGVPEEVLSLYINKFNAPYAEYHHAVDIKNLRAWDD